jgi:hypothetical protein
MLTVIGAQNSPATDSPRRPQQGLHVGIPPRAVGSTAYRIDRAHAAVGASMERLGSRIGERRIAALFSCIGDSTGSSQLARGLEIPFHCIRGSVLRTFAICWPTPRFSTRFACRASLLALPCLTGCESQEIRDAKRAASHDLFDPTSAQFREVRVGFDGNVCGELNSKNRLGAYVGFHRFVWHATRGLYVATNPEDEGQAFWADACVPAGPSRSATIEAGKRADSIAWAALPEREQAARLVRDIEEASAAFEAAGIGPNQGGAPHRPASTPPHR